MLIDAVGVYEDVVGVSRYVFEERALKHLQCEFHEVGSGVGETHGSSFKLEVSNAWDEEASVLPVWFV